MAVTLRARVYEALSHASSGQLYLLPLQLMGTEGIDFLHVVLFLLYGIYYGKLWQTMFISDHNKRINSQQIFVGVRIEYYNYTASM
jgi:hypothetical protein